MKPSSIEPSDIDNHILAVLRTSAKGMKAKHVRSGVNEICGEDKRADFYRNRLNQLKKFGYVTSYRGEDSENIWLAVDEMEIK